MAKSDDKSGTWADVVLQLLKTFLVLRDVFGYALPGAVFIAIGCYQKRIQLNTVASLAQPYHVPVWAVTILAIAGCYVIGHILSVIVYLPIDLAKSVAARSKRANWVDWVAKHPTEVNPGLVVIRQKHPELLIELDRRETLSILSGTLLAAVVTGWVVFCWLSVGVCNLLLVAGGLLLLDFITVIPHLRRVRSAIIQASQNFPAADQSSENEARQLLADLLDAAASALRAQKP